MANTKKDNVVTPEIVRTPTRASGGITEEEKVLLKAHSDKWIANALRTDTVDPSRLIPAIEGLYATVGLAKPKVVIVPSPLCMAFAFGAAAALWEEKMEKEKTATTPTSKKKKSA